MWWKAGAGIVIVGILGWLGWMAMRPVPGTKMADQGREHVSPAEVAAYQYNSNPPTSGQHLPTWVKAGVYDKPQSEGELIHSLEHGYVIISYNCNVHLKAFSRQLSAISQIFAHEESAFAEATADKEGSSSSDFVDPTPLRQGSEGQATGSAVNESDGCKTLVKQLTELANKRKLWKLIVVPRPPQSNAAGTFDVPQLDTTIALTAWTYLDTFDQFDEKRITRFIDYHRDQGPEKTME